MKKIVAYKEVKEIIRHYKIRGKRDKENPEHVLLDIIVKMRSICSFEDTSLLTYAFSQFNKANLSAKSGNTELAYRYFAETDIYADSLATTCATSNVFYGLRYSSESYLCYKRRDYTKAIGLLNKSIEFYHLLWKEGFPEGLIAALEIVNGGAKVGHGAE